MEIHEEFTKWAVDRGVKINDVSAHRFNGRGLGIIADKKLEPNTTIIHVPISALRTAHTVPKSISAAIGPITVHGLLAADLCFLSNPLFSPSQPKTTPKIDLTPWLTVLPTFSSFEESMPLLYTPSLQSLLPPAALALLTNQKTKLATDWAAVSKAFPDLQYKTYLHNWLIVNTRTFYFVSPKTKPKNVPKNRDDCMALNPFADYFNHTSPNAPTCCNVAFTAAGYTITTRPHPTPTIPAGSEIHISYGNHSNDFLLAEYGFIMSENEHDLISLDDLLLPLFSASQKAPLEEKGFLGNYVLDQDGPCYRTQVALRILCCSLQKWERIADGFEEGKDKKAAIDAILFKVLSKYKKEVLATIKKVEKLKEGLPSQRETLDRRWSQIDMLLQTAIDRI